jgi:NADH-quinone oxidoreductase subunit L
MAATIAMSQNDIKRVLAWSTCSQLGYMMAGLGVGAFSAGLFHLFTHAFFKAMLFLGSGAVILGCHHEQDIRKMGGLKSIMPYTWISFLIGTMSISGFPFMSGWFSKDEIITAALHRDPLIGGVLILTAGMTAFYMFRLYFLVFHGNYRGDHKAHEVASVMYIPLLLLMIPSIFVGGWLGFNPDVFLKGLEGVNAWGSFVFWGHPHVEKIDANLMAMSTGVAVIGFVIAWLMYMAKSINWNKEIVEKENPIWKFSYHKWYMDELYGYLVGGVFLPIFSRAWKWTDSVLIDGIVNSSSLMVTATGEVLKYAQTGRGQYYALVVFASVALIAWIAFLGS